MLIKTKQVLLKRRRSHWTEGTTYRDFELLTIRWRLHLGSNHGVFFTSYGSIAINQLMGDKQQQWQRNNNGVLTHSRLANLGLFESHVSDFCPTKHSNMTYQNKKAQRLATAAFVFIDLMSASWGVGWSWCPRTCKSTAVHLMVPFHLWFFKVKLSIHSACLHLEGVKYHKHTESQ